MRTGTIETPAGVAAAEEVVLTAMTNLNNGGIRETIASFAEEFSFKDHGLGLDFTDKAPVGRILREDARVLSRLFRASRRDFREWRSRESSNGPFEPR